MSTTTPTTNVFNNTYNDPMLAVEALREVASANAAESEQRRTLAGPVVNALRASGLLGFAVPAQLGGGGHSPSKQLEVFEAMARIDTGTGWVFMVSSMLAAIAGAYLPEAGAREVFAEGAPPCAGLIVPSGTLRSVPGGFRVDGRWAFGSGIRHAEWIVTSAVMPPQATDAAPDMRTIVVPARQVEIEDTWHVAGLRGTGSEHYTMRDVFVPEHRCFAFPAAPALRGGPEFDLPIVALLSAAHAGFALGAARAALDEIAQLAPTRIKAWPGIALGAHAAFHMDLGRADAKLRAARSYACSAIANVEQRVAAHSPLTLEDWRDLRTTVSFATDTATEIATFSFRAGGASALYEKSNIQRLFRDIHAAGQHIAATDDAYEFAGRLLLNKAEPHILMSPRQPRAST